MTQLVAMAQLISKFNVSIGTDYEGHWTNLSKLARTVPGWLALVPILRTQSAAQFHMSHDDGDGTMAQWEPPIPPSMEVGLNWRESNQ